MRDPALLFPDLRSAGIKLAKRLELYRGRTDVVVLTLVRGGVLVALEVAQKLDLPLDLVLLRRLLAPHGPETPVCAFSVAGELVVDDELKEIQSRAEPGLSFFIKDALSTLVGRERACRNGLLPSKLEGKTILLVDNGIRTGRTLRLAIGAIRTRNPARIVVAVPVAAVEAEKDMVNTADEFITLATRESFGHVGLWYVKYVVPEVEEIGRLMAKVRMPE